MPTVTAIASATTIGSLPPAGDPTIGSDGDLTGDGISDLWSISSTGSLTVRPGTTGNGTSTSAVTGFDPLFTIGNAASSSDQWSLKNTLTDTDAQNPATAFGGTGWGPDHTGEAPGAATFNGTTGYLKTAHPALDTTKSYTVSAWVKLNTLTSTQTAISQGTVNHQAFYLGYHAGLSSWYFMTITSDAVTTNFSTASGGTPTTGTWTHLAGVYDADSNVMSLYINGTLTSNAALNTTPVYNSSAPLNIGATLTLGSSTLPTRSTALSPTSAPTPQPSPPMKSQASTPPHNHTAPAPAPANSGGRGPSQNQKGREKQLCTGIFQHLRRRVPSRVL